MPCFPRLRSQSPAESPSMLLKVEASEREGIVLAACADAKKESLQSLPLLPFADFAQGASGLLLVLVSEGVIAWSHGSFIGGLRDGRVDSCKDMTLASVLSIEVVEKEPTLRVCLRSCSGVYLWMPQVQEVNGPRNHIFEVRAQDGGPLLQLGSGGCDLGIFAPRMAPLQLREIAANGLPEARRDRLLWAAARAALDHKELQGRRCHKEDASGQHRSFEELVLHVYELFYPATLTPASQDSWEPATEHRRISMASVSTESSFMEASHVLHQPGQEEHKLVEEDDEEAEVLAFARALWLHASQPYELNDSDAEWNLIDFDILSS